MLSQLVYPSNDDSGWGVGVGVGVGGGACSGDNDDDNDDDDEECEDVDDLLEYRSDDQVSCLDHLAY
jgi:hypothetical protein